jgi:hypothetical protein
VPLLQLRIEACSDPVLRASPAVCALHGRIRR